MALSKPRGKVGTGRRMGLRDARGRAGGVDLLQGPAHQLPRVKGPGEGGGRGVTRSVGGGDHAVGRSDDQRGPNQLLCSCTPVWSEIALPHVKKHQNLVFDETLDGYQTIRKTTTNKLHGAGTSDVPPLTPPPLGR